MLDSRAHGCVADGRRLLLTHVAGAHALGLMLVVGFVVLSGCAGSLSDASDAGELVSARATVAAVGFDVIDEAAASTPGGIEGERGHPEKSKASQTQPPQAPAPRVEVELDRKARRLAVAPHDSERVTVRITAVTLGEALMFLSGGRLVPSPDLVRVLTDPLDDVVQHVELGELIERTGSSLVTVTTEASRAGQRTAIVDQLVQLSPFELDASVHTGGVVYALLTDVDGRAIHDAALSLLDADGRLLAKARTDDEGHAVIESPPTPPVPAVLGDALYVVAEVDALLTIAVLP